MQSAIKIKRSNAVKCVIFFIFIISFFNAIKLFYIDNRTVGPVNDSKGFYDSLLSGYNNIFGKDTKTVSSVSAKPTISSCQSIYLDSVASHVKAAGCHSGQDCERLTCRALMTGSDPTVYNIARKFMNDHPKIVPDDNSLIKSVQNCTYFKQSRGYHKDILSETSDLPIAFSILMYDRSEQAERLLRSIYRPQNIYCIHVDGKAAASVRTAMESLARCFDNVFISSRTERVIHGGISRLQADINCMKDLVKQRHVPWRYMLNIASLAFPLQTPEDMVRILRIYNGSNDIEGMKGERLFRVRFEEEYIECPKTNSVNGTGRRHSFPPDLIDIIRGSAYGVFSRAFVEFVLTDSKARNLLEWSRNTYSPDEHYWATLHHLYSNPHLHSPGGYSGRPYGKPWLATYVKWGLQLFPWRCHGQHVRGLCVLGVEDLPELIPRKEFFVNKLYSNFQPLALDCLEAWLQHKTICPIEFDYNFYKALPFVKT